MKKIMMMSASLSVLALSGMAHAADFKTLTTTSSSENLQAQAAPSSATAAPVQVTPATPKKSGLLKGARVVPDTTSTQTPVSGKTFKKADQGYSNMSAYNVVNDQNKPITNDWTRPKNWRIGYKNKDRTPINE